MQASMSELVQFLEGRDDGAHQSTENEELMEPRSPSGREDPRALSKQLDDSNKLPPPSYIDELVFGFLGISEAEQNSAATSLCLPRDIVPSNPSAFKSSEPKTFAIDGSNESYGGNWDEGLLENDYDYPCLSSYAHEVVITTETQSSGTNDKETVDRLSTNTNEYALDVLAQEKLDVQGFQVEETMHMTSAPNVMCKSVIDTLQEDSTFFEDMGFDMRNSSELKDCKSYYESSTTEINAEESPEDVSPACSNLHIVPMSDGMDEVTASPPEEFAAPLSRDGIEIVSSPDVAKVPRSTGVGQTSPMSPPICHVVASTSQRAVFDLSSCCGPFGAVVKNQIVLPYSGDAIISENDSLDSQDYGMPKLVRADEPPPIVTDQIYDSPPELDPVEQTSTTTTKKGVKTTTSTLASAAGEDLLKCGKKITLDVVPETSQEELNDSLGKIVPSFTPDISNQMPAYMNDIYDVRNISLEPTCGTVANAGGGGSLPLLPVTEEPKAYKTFKKASSVTPPKKTKPPDVKSKDSCGVDKGFVRDLLRSVSGGPNSLSGPNCVVEFTNKAPVKPSIRKDLVAVVSSAHSKHLDTTQNNPVMGTLFNTSEATKNLLTDSVRLRKIPSTVDASSPKVDFKSLPDLSTLLDMCVVSSTDKVPFNPGIKDKSNAKPSALKRVSSSGHLSGIKGKTIPDLSNELDSVVQVAKKSEIPCNTSSAFTLSTSPKKTTTIIANVAQEVVNGVRTQAPQIVDNIKAKQSAQNNIQEKSATSTSVKVTSKKFTSPQELKVSLPISSLDLFSVKPNKIIESAKRIEDGNKETASVLGVSTPTMAQRKQYAVPCIQADAKSSLTEGPTNERKNGQNLAKTTSKPSVTVPSEIASVGVSGPKQHTTLDEFTGPKVLLKDPMGALDELNMCNQDMKSISGENRDVQSVRALKNSSDPRVQVELNSIDVALPVCSATVKKLTSSTVAPQMTDKINITNDNVGLLSEGLNCAKLIHGLLQGMNLTRVMDGPGSSNHPIENPETPSTAQQIPIKTTDPDPINKKYDNISCQIGGNVTKQNEGNCSSKHGAGLLGSDQVETADSLKEHPVIDLVNSLIQSSSKIQDAEPQESKVPATVEKPRTSPSEDTAAKMKSSPSDNVTEKLNPRSPINVDNEQVKTSLDVLQKTPLAQTAESEPIISARGVVDNQETSFQNTTKLMTGSPQNTGEKVELSASKEVIIEQKPLSANVVVEEVKAKIRSVVEKRKCSSQDVAKNISKPVAEVEKPQVGLSNDLDQQKKQLLKPSVVKIGKSKSVTSTTVVEQQNTKVSPGLAGNTVAPTLLEDDIKEKINTTADIAQKQIMATSVEALSVTKTSTLKHVDENKSVLQEEVVKKSSSSKNESLHTLKPVKPSNSIQKLKATSSHAAVGESKTASFGLVDQTESASFQAVVAESKTTSSPVMADRTSAASEQVLVDRPKTTSKKAVVNEQKTATPKIVTEKTKIAPTQAVAETGKEKVQAMVKKENDQSPQKTVEKKAQTREVIVENPEVEKSRGIVSPKVIVGSTNTSAPHDAKRRGKIKEIDEKADPQPSQKILETKKVVASKEVVGERKLSVDKTKMQKTVQLVVEADKTALPQDEGVKHGEKCQSTVEKEQTQTSHEVAKDKKISQSKEVVIEQKLVVQKQKTSFSEVVGDKKTTAQNKAGKIQAMVEKESTQTSQEMSEKTSKEVVVKRKPVTSNFETKNTKLSVSEVAGKCKEKAQNAEVKKSCIQNPHEDIGKINNVVIQRKRAIRTPETVSSNVVVDNSKRDFEEKVQGTIENPNSRISHAWKKENITLQSEEVVVRRKPAVEKSKTSSSKVLVDNAKCTIPLGVVGKSKENVPVTAEKESVQASHGVGVKIDSAHSEKMVDERKAAANNSKSVSSKAVADIMQDVAEKTKDKVRGTAEEVSTPTSHEVVEEKNSAHVKNAVVERKVAVPSTVSSKVSVDNHSISHKMDEKVPTVNTVGKESIKTSNVDVDKKKKLPSKEVVAAIESSSSNEVVNNQKSISADIDPRRKTVSLEDVTHKPATDPSPGVIDKQKIARQAVNEKTTVGLKKSKSSEILVGLVNSRTTKIVDKARKLSLESVDSRKDVKVERAKKPALGHWRIVKQDKSASIESRSASLSKISDKAQEEDKPRVRRRSETSSEGISVGETVHGRSPQLQSAVTAVNDAKLVERSDKLLSKEGKPAITADSKAHSRKSGAVKDMKEEKGRLRTRSDTSNERMMKDDGTCYPVGSDEEVSSNSPHRKQVMDLEKNTAKNKENKNKDMNNSSFSADVMQKQIESANKTSVKQSKKSSSVDSKAQPNVPETTMDDKKVRSRTRRDKSVDKKIQDNKNSSNHYIDEPIVNSNTRSLPAQNVDETEIGKNINNLSDKPSSAAALSDPVQEETKTRLRTRSETTNEKKIQDHSIQSIGSDQQVDHSATLAKRNTSVDKHPVKHIKGVGSLDVKSSTRLSRSDSTQEGKNHRLRTRSETSSEKKVKKDDNSSRLTNPPQKTAKSVPKPIDDADKISVNDVYDFIDDDAQSNIHTIDQFRTLSGKSVKNKRSPLHVSGESEPSVIAVEDENKLTISTRKARNENTKEASGRNSRKSSPKKVPVKKDGFVTEKLVKSDIDDEKESSKSPERDIIDAKKEGSSVKTSENHSGTKEGAATRSRSRDLLNDKDNVSPTRLLRSKVKQTVSNPAAISLQVNDEKPTEDAAALPEIANDQKVKATSKVVPCKPELSCGKCDSTTEDTTSNKHQSALTKNDVQNIEIENVDNSLNRRKTRSSIKSTPKIIENSALESNQLSRDNLLLPKLRSSVSRKISCSPVTLTNEANRSSGKQLHAADQRVLLDGDDNLIDTTSLKSEKVGDELKIIIKKVKNPVQGDNTDSSIVSDGDIVQKSVREPARADFISKEKLKPVKILVDVGSEVLPNQSTMLSSQDNTVCNAEAVSLKTPPMGSVVTPEPDNIQAVNDMSQHREPEGAKSSTRTAQLRSLALSQGMGNDERELISFQRDKDRGKKKRLGRERSISDKTPNVPSSVNQKDKPQNSTVDSPSVVKTAKQPPNYDGNVQGSSRNSSPIKTSKSSIPESNKHDGSLAMDDTGNENDSVSSRRVTRSSSTSASDGLLVKSNKKGASENDSSKPRRGSHGSLTVSSAVRRNNDSNDSSGLRSKKILKDTCKQTGKRLPGKFENIETTQDEVPVKSKLRKIESTVKVNSTEPESQPDSPKISIAPIKSKRSSSPDKKPLNPEGIVLKRSSLEPKTLGATKKMPLSSDSKSNADGVSLSKEIAKKIIDPNTSIPSTERDLVPTLTKHEPSKADTAGISSPGEVMTSDESVKSPAKQQIPGKSSYSKRKSKMIPPIKRVPSNSGTNLIEIGRKTSVKDVCLASESLDKILLEEDIKEVPPSFEALVQSPGKSPDSTTQSRADMVTSKLSQEPQIVNTEKISEDSQGVTSTTEIETALIVENKTKPSLLKNGAKSHDVSEGKKEGGKEDEGVSSTTIDSKLCSIPYSDDTKFVVNKKKTIVKANHTSRQSVDGPSTESYTQSKNESAEKPLSSTKTVPEAVSNQLMGLDVEVLVVNSQKHSPSDSSVSDGSSEYDVLHPRRKIWRVNPDLNKRSFDGSVIKVQPSSRENELSNVKPLSDEEMKRTPLKKRQVWGIPVDNNIVNVKRVDESPQKEGKSEAMQSPTSSVDHLRFSIYNILSVGSGDKNAPIIQKADSRSVSKVGSVSSRSTSEKRTAKCRKSSEKVRPRCPKTSVIMKGGSLQRRRGLHKSSMLMRSLTLRNGKTKLRKLSRKVKRVKPQRLIKLLDEQPGASHDQPLIVIDKTVELPVKYEDRESPPKPCSSNKHQTATALQPKLAQDELVELSPSNSLSTNVVCNNPNPSVNIPSSLPNTPNYNELTVDPCEDEEASPQYSPLRPRDQDPIGQELPVQVHSNFSASFTPITPEWSKQSSSGNLIVPSVSTKGSSSTSFIVSPQDTPVPRPIIERSRSFSSLGQTSKPRVRRESHPALPPVVQSPTPVDLSFRRKKSPSDGSTSRLSVSPEGLMVPTNIGKLDLNGQNPTFYTSFSGDIVTYNLAENQVVCMKPSSTTCLNLPRDSMPPMNDQLTGPTPNSTIPIRPIPIPNHKVRPAAVVTYPPLSGNKVKIDNFMPATKSSFNEYSQYLYQHPISAFRAMKSNNASSRSPNSTQQKKTDYNPLLFTHGTHFMLTPADISNMSSLCPSTSAPTLTPSRRNKITRSNRIKSDASSSTPKISFSNPTSREEVGRSSGNSGKGENIGTKPLFNQPKGNCAPYYSDDSYNLSCLNSNLSIHPSSSLLTTTAILPAAGRRYNKNGNGKNDQSVLGRNQEALQRVVREFNEGMNSIKDSSTVSCSKERSKSDEISNLTGSGDSSVKKVNFNKCSKTNVPAPKGIAANFNITTPNAIVTTVEVADDLISAGSKSEELNQSKIELSELAKVPDVVQNQRSKCNVLPTLEVTRVNYKSEDVNGNQDSKQVDICTEEIDVSKGNFQSEIARSNVSPSNNYQEKCDTNADNAASFKTADTLGEGSCQSALENFPVTVLDKERIESPDDKVPKINETSSVVTSESCTNSGRVERKGSLPTVELKHFEHQGVDCGADPNLDECGRDKAAKDMNKLEMETESSSENLLQTTTEIPEQLKSVGLHVETELGSDNLAQSTPKFSEQLKSVLQLVVTKSSSDNLLCATIVPEQPKSVPHQVETDPEVDQNINKDPVMNKHDVDTGNVTAIRTHVGCGDLVHETQRPANDEPVMLLPEKSLIQPEIQVDNSNKSAETYIRIIETTKKIDESSPTHCEQQSKSPHKPETSTKPNTELPTEDCELSLIPDDRICLNKSPMEPVAPQFLQPIASSNVTSIKQDLIQLTDKLDPKDFNSCTEQLPSSEASCHTVDSVKSDFNEDETDIVLVPLSTESQRQNTEKQADSVNSSEVLEGGSDLPSNLNDTSDSEEFLVDVSDKLSSSRNPADDNSIPLDCTSKADVDDSAVTLEPISNSKSSNPIKLTDLCTNEVIPVGPLTSREPASVVSESPEDPITSLTPQNSPEVAEIPPDTRNPDSSSSYIIGDHEDTVPSLDTLPPSIPIVNGDKLNTLTEISVHSPCSESVIQATDPNSDSRESSNISMGSKNDKDPTREVKGGKVEETIGVESSVTSISHRNRRKRKLPIDSEDEEDEDLQPSKSFDSTTCFIEKCKKLQAKVQIRPISPTTVDRVVRSGLKINHSELQDIVKCWQEYCRSSDMTVSRAQSDEVTVGTSREVKTREETMRTAGFGDMISRPSTSRNVRTESSSPLNGSTSKRDPKNVAAYLLEREVIKNEFIKRGQKRTRVRESFARGIKIYHRDSDVQNRGLEVVASSSRRSSRIADTMSAVTPTQPSIHRSYSWILEYLRERRRAIQRVESMNVQSCKDFVSGVSRDAVPGRQIMPRDSRAVAAHPRLSGSVVPPPTIVPSPTSPGETAITVISSDSEDSNPSGTEHIMKDRDEVRKRIRRKVGSFVYPSCSCPSPGSNLNSNVCPTCRKERNHAQGASSPVRSSSTPLYTKVSNMQRREPERVMKCAATVGGGEETVIAPDSDPVHLLKALMSLAGRRPPSSDIPVTTYAPPCSLSCDDPVPTSHSEIFALPYEKELLSPRVTFVPDLPLHDASPQQPETARGSSTRCLPPKSACEPPCLLEGNDNNLQLHSKQGIASRSQAVPLLPNMPAGSSTSRLTHPSTKVDDQRFLPADRSAGSDRVSRDAPSTSHQLASPDNSQVSLTQQLPATIDDSPSTPNTAEEAKKLLGRIVGELITPDILVDIQRLLSGEPPSKKRKE